MTALRVSTGGGEAPTPVLRPPEIVARVGNSTKKVIAGGVVK